MEPPLAVAGVFLILLSWLSGIILAYYGFQFYKLKTNMVFLKRHGNIVTVYSLCSIIILLIGLPLTISLHFNWKLVTKSKSATYMTLELLNDLLYSPFYYIGAAYALLRYWLIYFDIQFATSCSNLKWKQIITKNIQTLRKEQWYIYYRSTIGSEFYMKKRLTIFCIIFSITVLTLNYMFAFGVTKQRLWISINVLFFFVIVFGIVVIFKKMPSFKDTIFLYKEFKIISFWWSLSLFLYFFSIILAIIFGEDWVIKFIEFTAQIFGATSISLVSTFWVMRQFQSEALSNLTKVINFQDQMSNNTRQKHVDLHSQSVKMTLKSEELIDAFMQHLSEEFAFESLLALIEFIQYKSYIMNEFELELSETTNDDVFIELATNIPKSDIVYSGSNTDLMSFRAKAYNLYSKYIMEGKEFEINISYAQRDQFDTMMFDGYDSFINNDEIDEVFLLKIFDEVIQEMIQLLSYSKTRFVSNLGEEHIKI